MVRPISYDSAYETSILLMDSVIAEFCVSLAGIFAALLWLRPGKHEAARYAMILLPAGALYTLLVQDTQGWQYRVLFHVSQSLVLLLYLLGAYMLKCPWRRVILSCGIYSLVCSVAGLFIAALDVQDVSFVLRLAGNVIFDYAWIWLFIWLCSRKSEMGGKWISLLAVGAYLTLRGLIFSNLKAVVSMGDLIVCVDIIIALLCFFFVLRNVLQQSLKLSLITSALYITPTVLSHLLLWYYINNMT